MKKKIEKLSKEQEDKLIEYKDKWMKIMFYDKMEEYLKWIL